MAITALELITRAYHLSQIVGREIQTVSGSQIADGLYLLNALLEVKGLDLRLIPYYDRDSFPTIAGVDEYFIENLLAIDTMTFNLGTVRYGMREMSRRDFFGSPRVNNVQSLMYAYREERALGGMKIYLYFVPNAVYTVEYSGKFALTNVLLETELTTVYDLYYIEYLRHALANAICSDYGATLPDATYKMYIEIQKKLMDISPRDLAIGKMSYFRDRRYGSGWAQANIGLGYYPS